MKILAFAVILAVMQAAPPVPGQAPNSPASAGSKVQCQPKSEEKPAGSPLPSIDAKQATYHNAAGNGKGSDNAQYSVSVSEFPPVTVKEHKRDWADWGYWAFNLGLVLVGALQVVLLCWTLRAIRRQALTMSQQRLVMLRQWRAMREQVTEMRGQVAEMKEQTKATQDNAATAKANTDALINSERGWIMAQIRWSAEMLGIPDPTYLKVIDGSGSAGDTLSVDVHLIYINNGGTPAWVTERRILFRQVEMLPLPPQFDVLPGDYQVIGPEPVRVGGRGKVPATLTCAGHRKPGKKLIIYGFIKYRDVFNPERETRFGYIVTPDNKIERIVGDGDWWQYNSYT